MNNQQFERLVHNLQDIMRCPHCSSKYTPADIHYLGQLDSMTFLHMRCSGCHTPVFASVALANDQGDILPTEITADDIAVTSGLDQAADAADAGFEFRSLEATEELAGHEVEVENLPMEQLFASLTPVSYNDVLDTHQYLKEFDGDFDRIFIH